MPSGIFIIQKYRSNSEIQKHFTEAYKSDCFAVIVMIENPEWN
jgi:hypothetical protein